MNWRSRLGASALCTFALLGRSEAQTILYVDDTAAGANDGTSWQDAFVHLQNALKPAPPMSQIWVAVGTYRPDQGNGQTPGDRSATFGLKSTVAVYGGFEGTEGSLGERVGLFDQTILCGDLAGDDQPGFVNYGENSLHVVTADGVASTAVLDGFTIRGARANGVVSGGSDGDDRGAGLTADGDPLLQNCAIRNNWARTGGGGARLTGAATLIDCSFVSNRTHAEGAGVYATGSINLTFVRCRFDANEAFKGDLQNSSTLGGGLFLRLETATSSARVVQCEFTGNTSVGDEATQGPKEGSGGGLWVSNDGTLEVIQCRFSGNHARTTGGAAVINVAMGQTAVVTGCTVTGNTVTDPQPRAGGIQAGSTALGDFLIENCVLWGNSNGSGFTEEAQLEQQGMVELNFSAIQGLTGAIPGTGNIGLDPLFVDPDGPDDVLGTADDDLRLQPGSPCIDRGSNVLVPADVADLDGDGDVLEPTPLDGAGCARFVDDPASSDAGVGPAPIVDMGAHEFQIQTLAADLVALSIGAGGTQTLALCAGPAFAGMPYLLLGSASGTSPGVPVSPETLPLNLDAYLLATIVNPQAPPLTGALGLLNPDGAATASFTLPPGGPAPALAGTTLHHAFLVLNGSFGAVFTSDPVALALLP